MEVIRITRPCLYPEAFCEPLVLSNAVQLRYACFYANLDFFYLLATRSKTLKAGSCATRSADKRGHIGRPCKKEEGVRRRVKENVPKAIVGGAVYK